MDGSVRRWRGTRSATSAPPIEAAAPTRKHTWKADSLGMDNIHYDFPVGGSHSWGYWQDDLAQSWPMLSAPLYEQN